jgi:hypothetical protein
MPVREDMHRSCGSASSRKRAIAAAVEVLGLQVSIRAAPAEGLGKAGATDGRNARGISGLFACLAPRGFRMINRDRNYRDNPIAWVVIAIVVIAAIAAIFYSTGNHTIASNQTSAPATTTSSTNRPTTTGSGAGSPASAPSTAPANTGTGSK